MQEDNKKHQQSKNMEPEGVKTRVDADSHVSDAEGEEKRNIISGESPAEEKTEEPKKMEESGIEKSGDSSNDEVSIDEPDTEESVESRRESTETGKAAVEEPEMDINRLWNRQIGDLRRQDDQLPESAKSNKSDEISARMESFLDDIQQVNAVETANEYNEFEKWSTEVKKWHGIYETIFKELPGIISAAEGYLESLEDEKLANLPESVQKILSNRKGGVNIIARMFSRLPDRKKEISDLVLSFRKNGEIKQEMGALLKKALEINEDTRKEDIIPALEKAGKAVLADYDKIREQNYQTVRDQREAAEKMKKQTLNFLEQQLIPAVDGIDGGVQNAEEMKKPLEEFSEHREIIDKWFGVYDEMDKDISNFFDKINVRKIAVRQGDKFDENIHNAMSTEENPEMENETINSVIRNGYIVNNILIRAADVEVVMND